MRDEGGHAATIKYIGGVASAKDTSAVYLGVEWDEPSRGKVLIGALISARVKMPVAKLASLY